jgi:hypothetical protein
MKTKYTREELRHLVLQQAQGPEIAGITSYLEVRLYEYLTAQIRERQDKLRYLTSHHRGLVSYWAHPDLDYRGLTPGCHNCIEGRITHIRHSTKCTQNCLFCYYHNHNIPPMAKNQYEVSNATKLFTLEELKVVFDKQGSSVDAVGWLYKEPLMEMEKMEPVMKYLSKLGHFQYLYTNGVFATPENLVKLHHWGLNEIRFNLSATHFSEKAIKNLAAAARLFEWIVIEIPVYEQVYDDFIENKDAILDTGLTHINLAELQLNVNTWNHYDGDPTILYRHRFGNLSPVTSREFIYDIIELAEEEMWPLVINDCSNDTKYYRDLVADPEFPGISTYEPKMGVPSETFYWIIDNVIEDEVEIF